MKYIPYTVSVKWDDNSQGEANFETEEGLRQWLADADFDHTKQVIIQHNPMQIGLSYELTVHQQGE